MKNKILALMTLALVSLFAACQTTSGEYIERQSSALDFVCPEGCTCVCTGTAGSAGAGGEAGEPASGGASGAGTAGGGASGAGAGGTAGTAGTGVGHSCNLASLPLDAWVQLPVQPLNPIGSSGRATYGITADTSAPGVVYSTAAQGISGGGIFRSENCGASWSEVGSFHIMSFVRVSPDGQTLHAINGVNGDKGMWTSYDRGTTWAMRSLGTHPSFSSYPDDLYRIAIDPSNFNHILLSAHTPGTGNNSGVLRSQDGGATWTAISPPSGAVGTGNHISFLDNSTSWLYGSQNLGFYRTTDAGVTWTRVLTNQMTHGSSQVHRDPSGAYWLGAWNGVFRSSNGGLNWTNQKPGANGTWTAIGGNNTLVFAGPPQQRWGIYDATVSPPGNITHRGAMAGEAFEYAYDPTLKISYASNQDGGIWAYRSSL